MIKMDQQQHELFNPFEVPKPQGEQVPPNEQLDALPVTEFDAARAVEKALPSPASPVRPDTASSSIPPLQQPVEPPVPVSPEALAHNPLAFNTPATAEDADLIEKEWVVKAKEIIDRTKRDPHLQTKEMSKFKAGYLQKRVGKGLKLTEE